MDQAESMQAEAKAYRFNPDNVAPPEVQKRLWALLKWRDGVFRSVSKKIESIPGLESLIDNLADALNACTFCMRSSTHGWLILGHRCLHGSCSVALGECALPSSHNRSD